MKKSKKVEKKRASKQVMTIHNATSRNHTVKFPARIQKQLTYRVGVFGFWNTKPRKLRGVLDKAFGQIFDAHDGPRLALLPGVVSHGKGWPQGHDEVCRTAAKHRVAVLFEAVLPDGNAAYHACKASGKLLPVQIPQRFATSQQANRHPTVVADLLADCKPGRERTVNLEGLPIGLLICGENNILTNKQSDKAVRNRPSVRHHPDANLFEHVPVVFNGAHFNMGNWGKLSRRCEYLSRDGRWCFYAANSDQNDWGCSTLYAYHDSNKLANSSGIISDVARPFAIRRIADEPDKERFVALSLDIPGALLTQY